MITIYSDGSCRGNGREDSQGGFGVVILDENENLIKAYQHFESNTTNNIQELKAILWAMVNYGLEPETTVYSDSAYCVNTLTDWMYRWKANGWIKRDGHIPENLNLIKAYDELESNGYKINLKKVVGHSNNKWNDMADALATGKIFVKDLNI